MANKLGSRIDKLAQGIEQLKLMRAQRDLLPRMIAEFNELLDQSMAVWDGGELKKQETVVSVTVASTVKSTEVNPWSNI